jgi:protein-tyrosine phosphatase
MFRILVVCMGNICRSPLAASALQALLAQRRLTHAFAVDSAGTYAGHQGEKPDRRAIAVATARGYSHIKRERARRIAPKDFEMFDLILAMDRSNLANLQRLCPANQLHKLHLFLEFASVAECSEVPDPYYGNDEGFERVMQLCEQGASGVLDRLAAARAER